MLNTFSSLKSGTLSTFHFSHLPDFFPGAFTILPLLAVGVNWQIAYAAYSSFLLLVLVLSAHQVYAEIVQEHQDQAFSFLVIFFAAIVYFYPQLLVGLLQVGVHGGSFVVSVLCAVLAWKIISSDSKIAWTAIFGMALIVGVAAFSDILFICEFVAPLIVASFGLIFFRQYPLSRIILVLNVFVIAGTSAGVLILQRLPISPLPPHDLKELSRNIIRFFHTAPASSFVGVVVLFFVVFLFSGMCLPRDRVRLPRVLDFHVNLLPAGSNADSYLFFWLFGLTASLLGLAVSVISFVGYGSYRYAIALFWWPVLLGPVFLAKAAVKLRRPLFVIAALSAAGLFVSAIVSPSPEFWASKIARCIDTKSRTLPLHEGLANYWTASPVTDFSNGRHIVSQIGENGDPYIWLNNTLDYFSDKEGKSLHKYDFVILNGLDGDQIIRKFGMPSHRFKCENVIVAQYDHPSMLRKAILRWFSKNID